MKACCRAGKWDGRGKRNYFGQAAIACLVVFPELFTLLKVGVFLLLKKYTAQLEDKQRKVRFVLLPSSQRRDSSRLNATTLQSVGPLWTL